MIIDYSLYLIIDDVICHPEDMVCVVRKLINADITCVQLRMKHSSIEIITTIGKSLLDLLKSKKIPLIINDHIEIAAKINADGIHIGQKDISYSKARKYLGYTKIIGLSIENIEQAQQYQYYDVDYFGVGPVFPTSTKQDAVNPIGIERLKKMTNLLKNPVIAIGGINFKNILSVLDAGVSGIAISSAILAASHPESEAKKLAKMIDSYRGKIEGQNDE